MNTNRNQLVGQVLCCMVGDKMDVSIC